MVMLVGLLLLCLIKETNNHLTCPGRFAGQDEIKKKCKLSTTNER
jgi:hypothetical protein